MNAYSDIKNLSLIIQPGDSFFPIVEAIDNATQSINMTIFRMNDPVVAEAMTKAVGRGVKVRAMIAEESKGWKKRNKKLGEELAGMGVEVGSPGNAELGPDKLRRYHYKIMTIDDTRSLVLTFNPTQKNLHYARDFGIVIRDQFITCELNRLFDADWKGEDFYPREVPLVISPFNSRPKILDLLNSATRTIRILDAKVQDPEVIAALSQKAADGVDIRIIGRDMRSSITLPNLQLKQLSTFKLHAKCLVVDGARFFVGSQNLRRVSLDNRREVGIIIDDEAIARKIDRIFDEDWVNAVDILPVPLPV